MKLEKINETKLKIIFNSEELEEHNISLHSFLSNSTEFQKFFIALLEIASEDLNFNTYNCKISYEAFSFENKTFIIFINAEKKCSNPNITSSSLDNSNNFFNVIKDNTISQNSSFFFLNNTLIKSKKNPLYAFYSFEELLDFCNLLNNSFFTLNIESNLYQYNDIYFLEILIDKENFSKENNLKKLELICSDIKDETNFQENTVIRLKEFGNLLIEKNAISILG